MTTKAQPRPVSTKPYQANVAHWGGPTAVITVGFPDAGNRHDGLRFGYTAEIMIHAASPLGHIGPDIRVSQGSIGGTPPDDAMTRAQVYMLACEIGAVLLRLMSTEGKPMSEALALLAEGARFDNVDWKLKL
jgi:hypothetical protein